MSRRTEHLAKGCQGTLALGRALETPWQLCSLPCTGAVCWTAGTGTLVWPQCPPALCRAGKEQLAWQVEPCPCAEWARGAASLPQGPRVQPPALSVLPGCSLGGDFPHGVWSPMETLLAHV